MKINEILNENLDLDDLGFGEYNTDHDRRLNPECVKFAYENESYYDEIGYSSDGTPVITVVEEDPETHKIFDTFPQEGELQSPGFRGREKAKERSGQPHYEYQKYRDSYIPDPFRDINSGFLR